MNNILLEFTGLPPFSQITADAVKPAVEQALARCRSSIEPAVATTPVSWHSLITATEDSADGFAAPPPPPAMDEPGTNEDPAMSCDAKAGQWAVGKVADDALVARVKADTGSDRVRVIKPGMMVTMDYREDRVNLDVDKANKVLTVRCG